MAFHLFLAGVAVLVCFAALKPRAAALLIWPMLFTYPHAWWTTNNILPLNIGYDDVFLLTLFVSVLVHQQMIRREPLRLGWGFWALTSFMVIALVANLSGMTGPILSPRVDYYVDLMKLGVYWSIGFTVIHTVTTRADLERHLLAFALGAALGAGIIIAQYVNPAWAHYFLTPGWLEARLFVERGRSGGPFMSPNLAAVVLGTSSLILLALMTGERMKVYRLALMALLVPTLAGLAITQSRSGLIAFGVAISVIAFLAYERKYAWGVLVMAVLSIPFTADLWTGPLERLRELAFRDTGDLGPGVEGRLEIWRNHLSAMSMQDVVFGQGRRAATEAVGTHPHSAYIGLLAVYGLPGICWGLFFAGKFLTATTNAVRQAAEGMKNLGWLLLAVAVLLAVAGIGLDILNSRYSLYVFIFLVAVGDRYAAVVAGEAAHRHWAYWAWWRSNQPSAPAFR